MAEVAKNGRRKRNYAEFDQNQLAEMIFAHESKIARMGELDTFAANLKNVQETTNQVSAKLGHLQVDV